jgi:hypothetical protein
MLVGLTLPTRSFDNLSFRGVQLYAKFALPKLILDVSNRGTLPGRMASCLPLLANNLVKLHVFVDVSIAGVRLSAKYALLELVDDSSK